MPIQFRDFKDDTTGLLSGDFPSPDTYSVSAFVELKEYGLSACPSLSKPDGLNLNLSLMVPQTKINVNIDGALAVAPSLTIEAEGHNIDVTPLAGDISHTWKDGTFASHITTNVWEGLASEGGASVLVKEGVELGVGYKFDPYRSGLRDYSLAAHLTCPSHPGSAIYAAYGGMAGFSAAIAKPLTNQLSVVASYDKDDCIVVGGTYKSMCGATAKLQAKVCQRIAAVSVSRIVGDWNIALSSTFNCNKITEKPQFGLSISSA